MLRRYLYIDFHNVLRYNCNLGTVKIEGNRLSMNGDNTVYEALMRRFDLIK